MPSFRPNKPCLNYFMLESGKNALKTLKTQLRTYIHAYHYVIEFKPFQYNNIYKVVFCAKFHAKQTQC